MKNNNLIFVKRRNKLAHNLPDNSVCIVPNNELTIRSNDVEFKFKSDSDFYYLTGFDEPNSICVIKKEKRTYTYFLFVEERNKTKELWTGKKTGTHGAKSVYKADYSFPVSDFFDKLNGILNNADYIYFPYGKSKKLDRKIINHIKELKLQTRSGVKAPEGLLDPGKIIHKMRLVKDNYEIKLMKKAAAITRDAHIFTMAYARPGIFEYELEAILEYKFRSSGASGTAYPTIVGSGCNATILHYTRNNKLIKKNNLILIDGGCEYGNYASDVTRTFPATKKFSPAQKDIYEIVLEAQKNAIEKVRAGRQFIAPHTKAITTITEGLKELKLLKGSNEEIINKKKYKKFYMHNTSHWLGLDVHDAGPYFTKKGKSVKFEAGMVLTIEPGIYISNELDVPSEFKGIGIRIEDDVLVTRNGHEILTDGIPKELKDIESLS